ncbi:hypothetical protein J3R83DRAFT_2837, partial [Lanmaoa asiatica]
NEAWCRWYAFNASFPCRLFFNSSQTLNIDGTPKRLANAFMTFTRRREQQYFQLVMEQDELVRILLLHVHLTTDFVIIQSEKQFYFNQEYQVVCTRGERTTVRNVARLILFLVSPQTTYRAQTS